MRLQKFITSRPAGFTLVELLVTVGIIALLASLLVPQAEKLVDRADATKCMSNLRQIGGAFHLYLGDVDGAFPTSSGNNSTSGTGLTGSNPLTGGNWLVEIYGFLGKAITSVAEIKVKCPSFEKEYKKDNRWLPSTGSYGMNLRLRQPQNIRDTNSYTRVSMASIPEPQKTILAGDSSGYNLDPLADGKFAGAPDKLGGFQGGNPLMHAEKTAAHYLFVDGHVEALTPDRAAEFLKKRQPFSL